MKTGAQRPPGSLIVDSSFHCKLHWASGHQELVRTKQESPIQQLFCTDTDNPEVTFLSSPLLTYLLQSFSAKLS